MLTSYNVTFRYRQVGISVCIQHYSCMNYTYTHTYTYIVYSPLLKGSYFPLLSFREIKEKSFFS